MSFDEIAAYAQQCREMDAETLIDTCFHSVPFTDDPDDPTGLRKQGGTMAMIHRAELLHRLKPGKVERGALLEKVRAFFAADIRSPQDWAHWIAALIETNRVPMMEPEDAK